MKILKNSIIWIKLVHIYFFQEQSTNVKTSVKAALNSLILNFTKYLHSKRTCTISHTQSKLPNLTWHHRWWRWSYQIIQGISTSFPVTKVSLRLSVLCEGYGGGTGPQGRYTRSKRESRAACPPAFRALEGQMETCLSFCSASRDALH